MRGLPRLPRQTFSRPEPHTFIMAKTEIPEAVACKACKAEVHLKSSVFGHVMVCPGCQQQFLRAPGAAIHEQTVFACPMCRTALQGHMAVGSIVACQECGAQMPGPVLMPPPPEPEKKGH